VPSQLIGCNRELVNRFDQTRSLTLPARIGMYRLVVCRLLLVFVLAGTLGAQQSKAIYRQVASVATALTAGSAAEAMMPFDKSCAGYAELRDDFSALVSAYQLVSQIEILEQSIVGADATLTVRWVLTLSDPVTQLSETRAQDVTVKLSYLRYQWRIVGFSPLDLFNPELQKSRK